MCPHTPLICVRYCTQEFPPSTKKIRSDTFRTLYDRHLIHIIFANTTRAETLWYINTSFLFHLNPEGSYLLNTCTCYFFISVPDEKLGFELELGLVSSHPWATAPKHLCMWSGSILST